MTIDRLSHLQTAIEGYYEQLAGKESALRTIEESEKVRIEQQIRKVKQDIAKIQGEYWVLLKSQTAHLEITDADAEIMTAEIIQEVESLQYQPTVQSNAELVKLLTEIKAELTKPGIPGSGKLKAAIPLLRDEMSSGAETYAKELVSQF